MMMKIIIMGNNKNRTHRDKPRSFHSTNCRESRGEKSLTLGSRPFLNISSVITITGFPLHTDRINRELGVLLSRRFTSHYIVGVIPRLHRTPLSESNARRPASDARSMADVFERTSGNSKHTTLLYMMYFHNFIQHKLHKTM